MLELCEDYRENVRRVDAALRVDQNYDLIKKVIYLGQEEITLYYIDGFVDGGAMNKMIIYFLSLKSLGEEKERGEAAARWFLAHHVPYVEAEVTGDPALMMQMVLSGTSLILGETFGAYAIVVDSRTYPTRSVGEPENDRVMLGSRDGFVETLVFNTALIRRRVRDPQLTMKYMTIGTRSKTDIVMCYLNGQADAKYVQKLQKKLQSIDTGALTMGHESLAELLVKQRWYNPFPKIRYTERPDVAAAQVLEGSVLIVMDNSPEVMILPSTIFDFLQETNDYYFPPLTGTYIRFVRHIVFWATLFLVPMWFLLTKNPQITPSWLQFILPESTGKIPIFVQLILVEFMIDGLRMASMNTPDMLSNSLSVVGGLILGDFAVDIGWLIPEVIVYMAFVSIANFSQRSYQLGYAFKFMRIGLIVLVQLFNWIGFLAGVALIIVFLATNKTVNGKRSYLYPLIPFNGKALLSLFVRLRKDTYPDSIGIRRDEGAETSENKTD
ncbi:MAG: spore germination protein [Clostridia bacterium]|nr:spore germination protein [Clostridia bacterium]